MQPKNQPNLDFTRRTDSLAASLGCDLGELPTVLGFSRASLFAYRSGKARITKKAIQRLERAELEAERKRSDLALEIEQLIQGNPSLAPILLRAELDFVRDAAKHLLKDSKWLVESAKNAASKLELLPPEEVGDLPYDLEASAQVLERSVSTACRWLKALEDLYTADIEASETRKERSTRARSNQPAVDQDDKLST